MWAVADFLLFQIPLASEEECGYALDGSVQCNVSMCMFSMPDRAVRFGWSVCSMPERAVQWEEGYIQVLYFVSGRIRCPLARKRRVRRVPKGVARKLKHDR